MRYNRKARFQNGMPVANSDLAGELRNISNAVNVNAQIPEGVRDLEMQAGMKTTFADKPPAPNDDAVNAFGKCHVLESSANIYDHMSFPSSLYAIITPSDVQFTTVTLNANNQAIAGGASMFLLNFDFWVDNAGTREVYGHSGATAARTVIVRENRLAANASILEGEYMFIDEPGGAAHAIVVGAGGRWRRNFTVRLRNYSNAFQIRIGTLALGTAPLVTCRLLRWWE
jgi:hypothetical protein